MKKINIIHQSNAKSFVGVKINRGSVNCYVPMFFRCGSVLNEKDKKNIIKILNSINISKHNIKEEIIDLNENRSGSYWPIESYLWIIRDYIENGIYESKVIAYKRNTNGKLNWKRTIMNTPYISKHGFIYPDLIVSQIDYHQNEISKIYKFALKIACDRIGWLYDLFFDINDLSLLSINQMEHIISNELRNTFEDKKKKRFKIMLNILNNVSDDVKESDNCTFGINNYYYVYEKMIDSFFRGIQGNEKKVYNPPTYWHIQNRDKQNAPLEPDTICIKEIDKNRITYILDAKDYEFADNMKNSKGLPGSQSIQKQITYGDYVMNYIDSFDIKNGKILSSKIRNIFILPFDSKKENYGDNGSIVYLGYATAEWRSQNRYDHDYILAYLIDFNYLLNNYDKKVDSTLFFDNVEDNLSLIKKSQVL